MRRGVIHQFAPQVCQHDAVGNEVFALHSLFGSLGLDSYVWCDLADQPSAKHVRWCRRSAQLKGDLLLIHYSHGSGSYRRLLPHPERKILVYHSITPREYFVGTNTNSEEASRQGYAELPGYAERVDVAIAHSRYSARQLEQSGFRNVVVLPYVLYEPLYAVEPDRSLLDRYGRDGWVNLLTVGRVAPHKCLEDCIFVFDCFKRFVERKSRLFIVGSWEGTEAYLARLHRLVAKLGLHDVFFTGSVAQTTLMGLFKLADAYLCMSEHEGFGVPLVEAMRFDVPVFAYAATAVPETLHGAGVLFTEKSWPVVAEAIGLLLADGRLREQVISEQRRKAAFYSSEAARGRLRHWLETWNLLAPDGRGDP